MGAALAHSPDPSRLASGWPGRIPTTPNISATWRSPWSGVGDLLAERGEVGAALEHHTRALHIAERLAGADPDNPDYQRDVAVALGRVGDLLAGAG